MTFRTGPQRLSELIEQARQIGTRRVALAGADNPTALSALAEAVKRGVAQAVLVGDEASIRASIEQLDEGEVLLDRADFLEVKAEADVAQQAASAVHTGNVDLLMKGSLRTDQLLRAVLDRERGLRTARLLSDVLVYEDTLSGSTRLVGVTDGGVNVDPSEDDLTQIVMNAVDVFHRLGFERPRIALMSATEKVSEALPSTEVAQALTERAKAGELGECEVYGPLALDNALLGWAAQAKGLTSPVAGHADVMAVPNIEAGNLLGKAVKYFGKSVCAHVIMGAHAPVLIPSRVESVEDKLASIALGALMTEGVRP